MRNRLSILILVFLLITAFTMTYAEDINIVNTKALYESKDFVADVYLLMDKLNKVYPDITSIDIVGKSVEGRDLRTIQVGNGKKKIFINAAHHGKEYMTTILVMQQIELLSSSYRNNTIIDNVNIRDLLDEVSIVFMPLVNPDGVMIAKNGLDGTVTTAYVKNLISDSKKSFSDWKANSRGVDLNRNYATTRKYMADIPSRAASRNFPGAVSFTEPETQAVKKLCEEQDFELVLAYHSAGEIIYWYYFQETKEQTARDLGLAKMVSKITGYSVVPKTPNPGGGGMKDWFVQEYKKPGITIEIGKEIGEYSILKYSEYPLIWKKNNTVPIHLADFVRTTQIVGNTAKNNTHD